MNKINATMILSLGLSLSLAGLDAHAETTAPQFFTAPAPAPLATTAEVAAPLAATPISTSKDWRLFDLGTTCVAETVATVAGVNHHLEVRVDKTGTSPVEVAIRSELATTPVVGYKAALDRAKTKVLSFAKLSSNGTEEVFWNVPQTTEELLSYLKREMKFDAQAHDVTGALPGPDALISFSLRGSSASLADLGKRCAAGLTVPTPVDVSFEKAFLTDAIDAQVAAVDFSRVTPAKTDALRASLTEARKAFVSSKVSQSEIEKLNAKYLKEINELTGLRRNLDRLTQQEITRLEGARAQAQATIAQATTDIQNLKPQIAVKEGELVTANTAYEAAYNNVKGLLPEYNRLNQAVRSNESALGSAQSQLSSVESRINQANSELANLQNESREMRSRLSGEQNEAAQARSEYSRAQQEANSFDAQSEIRRRLQSDSRVSSIQRDLQDIDMRIRAQENAVHRFESDRNRLNQEFINCRNTPGMDCGPIQFELSETNRKIREAQDGVRVLEGTKSQKQDEMGQIRGRIEDEVRQIDDDLNRRASEAQSRSNNADNQLRDTENRLRSIDTIDIPARQNDIARLSNERSQLQNDVANADRRLRQARTDLANYRQSTGFDALQADVDRKLATVNGLKAELQTIDREIKKREKQITDSNASLAKISLEMDKVVATIKQKEARSVDVQKLLEPYELAKADLTAKKAVADQSFVTAQTTFSSNL